MTTNGIALSRHLPALKVKGHARCLSLLLNTHHSHMPCRQSECVHTSGLSRLLDITWHDVASIEGMCGILHPRSTTHTLHTSQPPDCTLPSLPCCCQPCHSHACCTAFCGILNPVVLPNCTARPRGSARSTFRSTRCGRSASRRSPGGPDMPRCAHLMSGCLKRLITVWDL